MSNGRKSKRSGERGEDGGVMRSGGTILFFIFFFLELIYTKYYNKTQ